MQPTIPNDAIVFVEIRADYVLDGGISVLTIDTAFLSNVLNGNLTAI